MSDQKQDNTEVLFLTLVQTFASNAMIQLGAQPNPFTNKTETNLQQASYSIDILEALRVKTEGNLTETEKNIFDKILSDLKGLYVQKNFKSENK